MTISPIMALAGLILMMKGRILSGGLDKSGTEDQRSRLGTFPDYPCRNRDAIIPLWKDGGTLYKMQFDFPWHDDFRDKFLGHNNDTYQYVYVVQCSRGKTHWNPNWDQILDLVERFELWAKSQQEKQVLVDPATITAIVALILAICELVRYLIGFVSWYNEIDCYFVVSKSVGTSHKAIQDEIKKTIPQIEFLLSEGKCVHYRHYGSVYWVNDHEMLQGKEEIDGGTVSLKLWNRYWRHT